MVDTTRYGEWIEKAMKDMKSAIVLKEHDCGNDMVAFHCQQAVEKALKGYLLFTGEGLVAGHSLLFLGKSAEKHHAGFRVMKKDLAFVNQYYLETRYPADTPLEVSEEDVQDCIQIASTIIKMVTDQIQNI